MGKKLYVGNLPYRITEQDLQDLFSQVGEITEIALITDRYTGQSKGFAFVEMATDEAAQEAITRFSGHDMDGRQLTVNEARPREEGGGRRDGGGRGGYGRNDRGGGGGGGRGRY